MKDDRERFVTREETDRLLAACPNIDWRVIVGLCRFGGLRCPSEVLTLEWADVDWEHGRFRVHSPKTEHHPGKASRVIPLFPELRAILEEAWEAAPEGAVYVVGNDAYRKAADTPGGWRNCNLRTQFGRILKRAGLEPWPRLFHALRASRETELGGRVPDPRRHGLAGQHAQDCHEALPDDDGIRLLKGDRAAGRKSGAKSGAVE